MSYTLPQVEVFQVFSQMPNSAVKNLNAFVFGPNYDLYRYGVAGEKSNTAIGTYTNTVKPAYKYPNIMAGATPDLDYVKVYADNVIAEFFATEGTVVDITTKNRVIFDDVLVTTFGPNGAVRANDIPRDIRVGDIFRYTDGTVKSARVTGLVADVVPADVLDPVAVSSNGPTVSVSNVYTPSVSNASVLAATATGTFKPLLSTGVLKETFEIVITTGGAAGIAKARVTSSTGNWDRTNVAIEAVDADGVIYLGGGITLTFTTASADYAIGDVFTVTSGCSFTATPATDIVTSGTYTGTTDRTYTLDVVRGGAYARVVTVAQPSTAPALAVNPGASGVPNWALWDGGSTEAEYIVRCTATDVDGTLAASEFTLEKTDGSISHIVAFSGETALDAGLFGNMADKGSGKQFAVGAEWRIHVSGSVPRIRVKDTLGNSPSVYFTTAGFTLGRGITVQVNSATLRAGDSFYIVAKAASDGPVKTITLSKSIDAIAVNGAISGSFCVQRSGVQFPKQRAHVPGEFNWTTQSTPIEGTGLFEDTITINPGLQVQDSGIMDDDGSRPLLTVVSADLFVEYRALRVGESVAIGSVDSITEVSGKLGTVHPDNPLAQCVYHARLNSGDRAVYYMALPTNNMDGWEKVLEAASLSGDVYMMVPTTDDPDVLSATTAHIMEMSDPTVKRWRIGFFAPPIPVADPIYTAAADPNGNEFLATVTSNGTANVVVKFVAFDGDPSTVTNATDDVRIGDKVRLNFDTDIWGNQTYEEYEVAAVDTNNSLVLKTGPSGALDVATKVEVWHPYVKSELADAIAVQSGAFYNSRIYRVFPPTFTYGGVMMNGPVGAAAVAGLASSVSPQQPITNVELLGFDDIPLVYQTFSRAQLNTMAGGGTLIVMQDTAGGKVYVRHQVSTRRIDEVLNSTELSLVKNTDSISYFFAAKFEKYIGKFNITPELLRVLNVVLIDGVQYLGSQTDVGLVGPQLLLESTVIGPMQQHPTLADVVIASLTAGLPNPFNGLQFYIYI